jgi:glycosyltransferase involved in cell wall biosynthesis
LRIIYLTSVRLDEPSAPSHHVLNTCKAMAGLGHCITLMHPGGAIGSEWQRPEIREFCLPYPRIRGGWRIFERLAAIRLSRLAAAGEHDLIYMRIAPSPVISRSLANIALPSVLELNGSEGVQSLDFQTLADAVDMIMVDSPEMSGIVAAALPAIAAKIRIHSNVGVDTTHFRPLTKSGCRRALRIPEAEKVQLHISGFQSHHDFETILQAMELLSQSDRDCRLLLLGNGRRWAEVRDSVSGLRCAPQITMPGAIPLSELPLYIGAADVCLNIVTAQALREGDFRATKLYEYMACERPAIATVFDSENAPEWAKRSLTLIPCEDPLALASAMQETLDPVQPDTRRVALGRQWVDANLSWKTSTETTLAHLRTFA